VLFSKWYTNSNPFIWYKGKDEEKTIEDRIYNADARFVLPNEPGSPGELMRAMLARAPRERWTVSKPSCKAGHLQSNLLNLIPW
jgi:hypothetical protein